MLGLVAGVILAATWELSAAGAEDSRRVISLDGTWEIVEGPMETSPDRLGRIQWAPKLHNERLLVWLDYIRAGR